jgi:PEP-CTERM motif
LDHHKALLSFRSQPSAQTRTIIMRKLLPILTVALTASTSFGAINWKTGTGVVLTNDDGTTPLVAARDDLTGSFIQLLWAGPNGLIDAASSAVGSNGAGGDDVVIDVAWLGIGLSSTPPAGVLAQQPEGGTSPVNLGPNNVIFARAWNAPWSGAVSGTTAALQLQVSDGTESTPIVTTSTSLRYGNSNTLQLSGTYSSIDTVTFDINAFSTNIPLTVVPEPTTAGLLGMGILGVIAAMKKRKQQA